jgi:phenylalanyl-tRNA synthetase beta chain
MPTVNVDVETLFALMGTKMTETEFEDLCFDFGIELEETTSTHKQQQKLKENDRLIYKIDIPANRYDMLCVEGIAAALRTYLLLGKPPVFTTIAPTIELKVEPQVNSLLN